MLKTGVLAGYPVLGMKATLIDGAFHDVDSSVLAFEIAGRGCCREGLRKGKVRLMEPMMQVRRRRRKLPSYFGRRRLRGISTSVAAASPRPASEYPRRGRGAPATRLGISTS